MALAWQDVIRNLALSNDVGGYGDQMLSVLSGGFYWPCTRQRDKSIRILKCVRDSLKQSLSAETASKEVALNIFGIFDKRLPVDNHNLCKKILGYAGIPQLSGRICRPRINVLLFRKLLRPDPLISEVSGASAGAE